MSRAGLGWAGGSGKTKAGVNIPSKYSKFYIPSQSAPSFFFHQITTTKPLLLEFLGPLIIFVSNSKFKRQRFSFCDSSAGWILTQFAQLGGENSIGFNSNSVSPSRLFAIIATEQLRLGGRRDRRQTATIDLLYGFDLLFEFDLEIIVCMCGFIHLSIQPSTIRYAAIDQVHRRRFGSFSFACVHPESTSVCLIWSNWGGQLDHLASWPLDRSSHDNQASQQANEGCQRIKNELL